MMPAGERSNVLFIRSSMVFSGIVAVQYVSTKTLTGCAIQIAYASCISAFFARHCATICLAIYLAI